MIIFDEVISDTKFFEVGDLCSHLDDLTIFHIGLLWRLPFVSATPL
jgi:hypothetical protein